MRVALIRPRCGDGEFQSPYGLECLQGYLRRHGHDARVFDRRLSPCTMDAFTERIVAFDPGWIGLSAMTEADMPDALRLIQRLRGNGRRFALGGLFVTSDVKRARALCPAEVALVSGEGERAMLQLVEGRAVDWGTLPVNAWPLACRDGLGAYLARGAAVSIRSARGCPGRCAFCATPGLHGSRFSARDESLVADEMASILARFPGAQFNFVDDDFGPLTRIEALCAALRAQNCSAAFSAEMRGPALYRASKLPDRLRAVHEGGLCRLFVGLESLNAATLATWGKPMDVERLLRSLREVRTAGIALHVGYILWHQGSTMQSVLAEATQLRNEGLFSPKLALSRMLLLPGSQLHRASGVHGSAMQALGPGMEAVYERVAQEMAPLFDVWTALSAQAPVLAGEAWMTGSRTAFDLLQTRIGRLNDRAYEGFVQATKQRGGEHGC